MNPIIISSAVTAAAHLIEFLLEARRNGQLSDDQLAQFTSTTNAETRLLIAQALGANL